MEKLGGLGGLMGMLPGVAKMKSQLESANLDDRVIRRQRAIIDSMTPAERRNPDILKASRKKRIASGAGAKVEEINKLLKMHRQMADVMKMMGGGKGKGMAGALGKMFGIGGGGMPQPTPEQIEALQKQMGGKLPDFPEARAACRPCPRACRACPAWADRRSRGCRGSAAFRSGRRSDDLGRQGWPCALCPMARSRWLDGFLVERLENRSIRQHVRRRLCGPLLENLRR
jgi:signal recognition particle subunit SRP54